MGRTAAKPNIPEPKRGALLALADKQVGSKRKLAEAFDCSKDTVRNIQKRAREAEKENIDPNSSETHQQRPRPGQPCKLSIRTKRQLIRHATKNRYQRRKTWWTIAQELKIEASTTTVNDVFYRNGYRRRPPKFKPSLTPEQKLERLDFAIEWLEKLEGKEHMVVYCDETAVRVGELRGQQWITILDEEEWHPDCVQHRYKGFTELMFWGCYTAEVRGPCYMFNKESIDEKKVAQKDLADKNSDYLVQQQVIKEHFLAEQAKKPKSRRRKRVPKPDGVLLERKKSNKGGIDWYRYQTFILLPRLIPFIHDIIDKYGHCYLVQDGAPAHNAWQQKQLLNIKGLTVLPWPGNSPDLNQIEPCWYHLKQQVSKRPFLLTKKSATAEAWDKEWEQLSSDKMKGWCMKMRIRLERVIEHKGGNNFHG